MVTRITGNEALHEAAKTHFQSLYTKDVHYRPKLDHLCFDKVGEPARRLLESEFAKGEIYSCLKDCDGDKASGPDGFNMTIFQSFWHEDMQSHSPLLYFWYAEAELNNSSGSSQESLSRAIHILCCLGSGMTYSPFKCQPSSLQLLRAHQGFRERIKSVRSTWSRGVIDDQSVALICSASLFEEATTGWAAGIDVLDQTLKTVLPERRSQSYQLEFLLNYYMKMVQRHYDQSGMSRVWESISQGLQMYPFSPELFNDLVEISHLYTTSNKLRWMFDDYFRKKPSMIVWLYALSFEIIRGASKHRIHGLFERALANEMLHKSVLLWRSYIAYEIKIACNPSAAKQIFFRAIHACPG
ncbi:protein NRDE2 homolog [Carica papaya]|uniref:protein NRDE2 homolog n=1 Tax=Carica papaya TaxID=3649 RepID=UPI000B8D1459|nr:protein NRDE2 homolog [Carica papaya]